MDKQLLIKSIFIFICCWGLGIIFLWFRSSIELFWKIIATFILAFYMWFFFEEMNAGYASFTLNWYTVFIDFLKEFLALAFTNLFFLWPLALIIIFYKADDIAAEKLLKIMCILTLVLWIVFIVYIFYNKGIDKFLHNNLKEMIPNAK